MIKYNLEAIDKAVILHTDKNAHSLVTRTCRINLF